MGQRILTNDRKRTQLDISRNHPSRYEDDPSDFIDQVVTQDETWVHHFDTESKLQSKQWKYHGSLPPKTLKRAHSAGKVMAPIVWDSQGVIVIDYLEKGKINGVINAGKLRRLRQKIAKTRQGKQTCCVLLLFSSCRTTPLPTRHKLP